MTVQGGGHVKSKLSNSAEYVRVCENTWHLEISLANFCFQWIFNGSAAKFDSILKVFLTFYMKC